jgi:predicted ATPase
MLTRLKVSGFKNLVDVDVRFGPFTCIAGANGVGKSNLFDAIRFLSALAEHPLVIAAKLVRDDEGRSGDIRNLFHRVGEHYASEMSFEAEMIIPQTGVDDFGQPAEAKGTFLKYSLTIGWSKQRLDPPALELLKEELQYVTLLKGEIAEHIMFDHEEDWRISVITQEKRGRNAPFISTSIETGQRVIKQHYDGTSGKPYGRDASKLPRTVLSAVNAAESPTVVLAKREMLSWHLLQLEPSSLRKPDRFDEFAAPSQIGADGAHLAATLARLAKENEGTIYQQVTNRLADLLDDVEDVAIDRDETQRVLTLMVKAKDGTWHPAQSLSDGTLRFLALAVMNIDPEMNGVICLEEPENGIHPQRIPAMLDLLQQIAVDPLYPVDETNPLRQVIINTHSPAVVQQVPDDSLIFAELVETYAEEQGFFKSVRFSGLSDTWRAVEPPDRNLAKGKILAYINPTAQDDELANGNGHSRPRRVIDRPDIQQLLLPLQWEDAGE